MKKFFSNLKKYQKYAVRNAKAELRSEVADSYLNWLWWIIDPLAFMMIYAFIFGVVFHNKTAYFASFVFVGLTTWDFFNRTVTGSVRLIASNRDLVKKVYIPKYILLISKTYTYLFKMGISIIIVFGLLIAQRVKLSYHMIAVIPVLLVLYLLSFGLGLILMHYGVLLNDLGNVVKILLRMVFYLSGVFFNIEERLSGATCFILLKVNPVAFLMHEMRATLIYNSFPDFGLLAIWGLISIGLCFLGVHLINKNENSYAKVI